MIKLILIAAISLFASQAYAGGPRSLSLAATNASQQATEQPATPTSPQTPPANAQTATTTPVMTAPATSPQTATAPAAGPAQPAIAPVAETAKPKHREPSTEARVIRELHRHGIYW